MGERKVLNKYYPPDFDPSKLPKQKRARDNAMKVRMMLPMSVRCGTCGEFMYKGTKFNVMKEDVRGEDYLGIQVYRFTFRCTNCAAEFALKTDPKAADYVVERGASRNYEPWKAEEEGKAAAAEGRRAEEETGDALKALENRAAESRREMDSLAALDEMRALRARQERLRPEDALRAALGGGGGGGGAGWSGAGGGGGGPGGGAAEGDEEAEDEAALRAFLREQRTVLAAGVAEAGAAAGAAAGSASSSEEQEEEEEDERARRRRKGESSSEEEEEEEDQGGDKGKAPVAEDGDPWPSASAAATKAPPKLPGGARLLVVAAKKKKESGGAAPAAAAAVAPAAAAPAGGLAGLMAAYSDSD